MSRRRSSGRPWCDIADDRDPGAGLGLGADPRPGPARARSWAREPRILLTPVRNALVALPEDVDLELAVAVWEAFAEGSSDELDVDPLRWTGPAVTAFDEDPSTSLVH